MGFGYYDKDWVDPPEVEEGKPKGCTCGQCGHYRSNPDGGLGYCVHMDEWYTDDDMDDCDEWYES